jgi:aminopeptidase N
MENWGLVTYREIALLADPKTASIATKQYVAMVVAHELSHQWFGNLVTMKWWNNLWLNESFATIMEYLAPNHFHPEWDLWFEFSTAEGVYALRRDCIDGVQSVQVDVNHPDEISSLFDGAIVYAKGGRLMRMMQSYIGEEAFRAGLHTYFKKYQYKNTTGNNLWDELSRASGKDISGLMNTWISQSGYPVVSASLTNGTLHLAQERFFVGPHEEAIELWPIPLKASVSGLPELFETETMSVPYDSEAAIHLNSDDSGHYIVHYDHTLRLRIIDEIKSGTLSNIQRAQFLHEQALLARGGYLASADLIELVAAYADEADEKVWGILQLIMSDLKKFVETDEAAEMLLRRLSADIARKQYERLGWDAKPGESDNDTQLRSTILSCMLYGEDEAVIAEAIARYKAADVASLDPELRGLILSAVVRHGKEPHIIDQLLELYRESPSPEIQQSITGAVTSTRNISDIHLLLSHLPQKTIIRHQDVIRWFVGILANREGRELAWQWLRDNWAWIDTTFGGDKSQDYFPRYSANLLNTRKQEREFIEFFSPLEKQPNLKRTIEMGKKDMAGRIELVERDSAGVIEALRKFYK